MASTKISDMAAGTTMVGAVLPVVQGSANKKVDSNLFTISNSLGALSVPITLSTSGYYNDYTLNTNLQVTFAESGHIEGQTKYVMMTTAGSNTLAFIKPSAYNVYIGSDFQNNQLMAAGSYLFAFSFINGSIKISFQYISAITALQQSASFNGTSSYIVADSKISGLEFSSAGTDAAFSISFWMKVSAYPVANTKILRLFYDTGVAHYEVRFSTTGKVQLQLTGDTGGAVTINCESATAITTDTWTHVTLTYDASEANTGFEVYLNSVVEGSPTRSGAGSYTGMNTPQTASRLNIGRTENSSQYFGGLLDELAIWSKELDQTEVTELYNSGVVFDLTTHSAAANLELWMRFANNALDDSTNNYSLTNYGTTFSTDEP